jgi:hypothetical protein
MHAPPTQGSIPQSLPFSGLVVAASSQLPCPVRLPGVIPDLSVPESLPGSLESGAEAKWQGKCSVLSKWWLCELRI